MSVIEFNVRTANRFTLLDGDEPENLIDDSDIKLKKKNQNRKVRKPRVPIVPFINEQNEPVPERKPEVNRGEANGGRGGRVRVERSQNHGDNLAYQEHSTDDQSYQGRRGGRGGGFRGGRSGRPGHDDGESVRRDNKKKSGTITEVTEFPPEEVPSPEKDNVANDEVEKAKEEQSAEEPVEPEVRQLTLAEYKATFKIQETNFNTRKAGEGADKKLYKQLIPIARNEALCPDEQSEIAIDTKPENRKARETQVPIVVTFVNKRQEYLSERKQRGVNRGGASGGRGGRARVERPQNCNDNPEYQEHSTDDQSYRGRRGGRNGGFRGGRGGRPGNDNGEPGQHGNLDAEKQHLLNSGNYCGSSGGGISSGSNFRGRGSRNFRGHSGLSLDHPPADSHSPKQSDGADGGW